MSWRLAKGLAKGFAALLLALLLPGCPSGQKKELFAGGKTFYLDSNLGFTWAYPAAWQRDDGTLPQTVRWTAPLAETPEPAIRAEITALVPSRAAGGYRTLMKTFTLDHPNFNLTAEEDVELADGTPAREILGHTPARSFLVYFITSRWRAFTIAFSLPPEHYHRYLPLFREMAASFRVLE